MLEGLNQRVRLIMRRAFGLHSAKAALALVMLSAGLLHLTLPWETEHDRTHNFSSTGLTGGEDEPMT